MDALWDTSCITSSTNDVEYMTSLGIESNLDTAAEEKAFYYHRGIKDTKVERPILVLLHGYPQTSFMWRHVVSQLPSDLPLFIPDVPGYGRSSPLPTGHDKKNTSQAILHFLHTFLKNPDKQPIIIAGHDRGARICHRLAVDQANYPHFSFRGAILLDIVPTLTQWRTFGTAAAAVGGFHWPFLANVELATEMIKAQGGDAFVRICLSRWFGKSDAGLAKFRENNAIGVYGDAFKYESVIKASCDDYRAGAQEDIQLQEEDQKAGRKVDIDVLSLYSADYLGKRYDLQQVWQEWMGKGKLEVQGFGNSIGHFIAEEAPKETASVVLSFYNHHS